MKIFETYMKISLTIVRIFSKIYFQKAKPRNLKFFISTNSVVETSRKSPLSIITRVNSFSHPINRVSVPSGNVTKTTEKQRRNGGNGVYPHPIYIRGKKRRGLEEEYSKPAYESRPNKNSPLLLLLLPWNERSSDANIDIKGRQVRRLLLLRYLLLLLHPRKRNSSVIAPQIPVNKYFCIGIRLPLYLASVLSYLSPSRVRRRRTLIPRRVVSRRAPQRDLSARLSIGARWKRGLTSSSSLYDSS